MVGARAAAPLAEDGPAVSRFVESQMDKHRLPGVALALVEDGQVTYATGYGSAGGGRPVTADTPMGIGSISKSFTAVAILQLMEQGRVDLDAPVRTYLPWFAVADETASRGITLRHLLYHTSGLSEFGYKMKTPLAELDQPDVGMGWGFAQYHGEQWEHSAGADETFMSEILLAPEHGRGIVWLMNQQHLLDPARGQLNQGLTAILMDQQPDEGGLSMRALGLGTLAAVLVARGMTIRSFMKMRGWTDRSRSMSAVAIARTIAPHFLVPVVILLAVYRVMGPLLFGVDWAFNFRYVGFYMIPDIALLILVATVPDLVQGLYLSATVFIDRLRRRRSAQEIMSKSAQNTQPVADSLAAQGRSTL